MKDQCLGLSVNFWAYGVKQGVSQSLKTFDGEEKKEGQLLHLNLATFQSRRLKVKECNLVSLMDA